MTLVKMTMQAYSDPGFSTKAGKYTVFLNPESFSHKSENTYNTPHPPGEPGDTPRFSYASDGSVSFSLVLDGTRTIGGKSIEVSAEIAKLKAVVLAYHGAIHSPFYVQLVWGNFLFNCRLTTFNVNYTLFRPDGTPVRAKVDLVFISAMDSKTLALLANKQSADLSHHYQVKAGDTLPQLCYRIYGDSKYYLQVAAHNHLIHFSRLVPGTVLSFPPLI